MLAATRSLWLAAPLFTLSITARAGAPADVAGHWEGAVHTSNEDVQIVVDISLDADDKLIGTFGNPSQSLKGFPLRLVAVDGTAVTLELKTADPGVQTFNGNLSADSREMSGNFLVGIYSIPFSLTRTGDAEIAPVSRGPALDATLAGEWQGTLAAGSRELPLALVLANHADGTSTGTWAAGEGPPTPIAIALNGANVTLTSTVTPIEFKGAVNGAGTEIVGTMTQGTVVRPVTFTRATPAEHR
jgi:hypothetical protein